MELARIKELLDQIIEMLSASGIPNALAERTDALKLIRRDLETAKLRIGVIGITSSGKSAFLNALIGEELIPEQSVPTSNVLTYLQKGERILKVSFRDGRSQTYCGEQLTKEIMFNFTSEEQNPNNRLNLERVDLKHPNLPFATQVELVDTPGLNAHGHKWHQQVTLETFVPFADIFIYMTSIRNPFKKADYEAVGRILEYDQRILFVISGKDLEKDDHEGGKIITSKESKLDKHLERLRKDILKCEGLHNASHVLIDSHTALTSHRDPIIWKNSGFHELLEILHGFEKDLTIIISESRLKRISYHLQRAIETAEAKLEAILGENQKAQIHVTSIIEQVKSFKKAIEKVNEGINGLGISIKENSISSALQNHRLTKNSQKSEFDALIKKCDDKLHDAYKTLKKTADSTRDVITQIIKSTGLEVPRNPIPETSLDNLPTADVQTKSEKEDYTVKLGFGFRLKFWPHEETRTRNVHVNDVSQFLTDLKSRINAGIERLHHYAETLKKMFTSRYLNPLSGELHKLENELESFKRMIGSEIDEKKTINVLDFLKKVLKEIQGNDNLEHKSQFRTSDEEKLKQQSSALHKRTNDKVDAFKYFLASYRELSFCRRLFKYLGLDERPSVPLRVAIVGLDISDRGRIVDLMMHHLNQIPDSTDNNIFWLAGKKQKLPMTFKLWSAHQLVLWDWVSLLIAPNDDCTDVWKQYSASMVQWAERVLVLVDGPRIGSGLDSLNEAPYCKYLDKNPQKVIYIIPHGAKFDDKIEHLTKQVVPYLYKESPYGERPIIIHENYDTRYTDFLKLFAEVKTGKELRRLWKASRISLEPPFTEKTLEDIYLEYK